MLTFSKNRVPFYGEKKMESETSLEVITPPPTPTNIAEIKTDIFNFPPEMQRESAKLNIFNFPPELKRQESQGLETNIEIKLKPKEATIDCSCGLSFFRRLRHR